MINIINTKVNQYIGLIIKILIEFAVIIIAITPLLIWYKGINLIGHVNINLQKMLQDISFNIDERSDIITAVYGVTSGILTLVGLISIYISLNSQHNIQKAREILWQIKEDLIKFYESNTYDSKETCLKVKLYNEIVDSKTFPFTKFVIWCAKGSLVFVWLTWITLCYIRHFQFSGNYLFVITLGGGFIIVLFYIALTMLGSTHFISGLPKVNELLSIKHETGDLDTLLLAAVDLNLSIERVADLLSLRINNSLSIEGLKLVCIPSRTLSVKVLINSELSSCSFDLDIYKKELNSVLSLMDSMIDITGLNKLDRHGFNPEVKLTEVSPIKVYLLDEKQNRMLPIHYSYNFDTINEPFSLDHDGIKRLELEKVPGRIKEYSSIDELQKELQCIFDENEKAKVV